MVNIRIARQALDSIRKYPEYHDQSKWVHDRRASYPALAEPFPVAADNGEHPPCGTTLCYGGWVAFNNAPERSQISSKTQMVVNPAVGGQGICEYATSLLEVTPSQANALFFYAGDLNELTAMVDYLEDNPAADLAALCVAAGLDVPEDDAYADNGTWLDGWPDEEDD